MLVKTLHAVLAHGEDLGVHGIGVLGGDGNVGHDGWSRGSAIFNGQEEECEI
jgi:hypothetical protein